MSVAQQTPFAISTGNGASTVYPFNFQILAAGDMAAYLDTVQKTLGVDFTIAGVGNAAGGSVTWLTAPASGVRVTLTRAMSKSRGTDYQQAGDFLTPVVNSDFDRALLISQELAAADLRGIRVAPYEQSSNMLLAPIATRKNMFPYFDNNGDLAYAVGLATGTLSQSTIGGFLTPSTDAEIAASVTPVKTWYAEGDVRRYGAFLDGVIDDTVAIQNWAKVAGALAWPVAKTAKVTGEIPLSSNTTITGALGATINQTVANLAIFRATSKANIRIRGMHLKQASTAIGASAYIAGILFDQCSNCVAVENEFEGFQWCGVYLSASSNCQVRGNYFHNFYAGQALTLTAAPIAGATSGTLTAAWTQATGSYPVGFTETAGGLVEGRVVVLTNGSTAANWSASPIGPGLGANCNAAIAVQCLNDSCDVGVHSNASAVAASYNIIESNICNGGCHVGISIQDPYAGSLPQKNIVAHNRVGPHLGYCILNYMPTAGDSYTQIIGNQCEGATGSYALNQSAGAGIYSVGAGSGGLTIQGNQVRDCCKSTVNTTLAPAGIGIAGSSAGTQPISVIGNSIDAMSQYHGILFTGILSGGVIANNIIRQPAANITGHGIFVVNGDGVAVIGNKVTQLNTTTSQRGIMFQGLNLAASNHVCQGNTVTGGHISQIECSQTGVGQVVGLTVSGNTCAGGDASCIPFLLGSGSAIDVEVAGNHFLANPGAPSVVKQTACQNVTYVGNRIKGPAGTTMDFSGDNSGSLVDESNTGILAPGVSNAGADGTSATFHLRGSIAPVWGATRRGDRQVNTLPLAAGTYLWITTTGGVGAGATIKVVANT